ncbi:MAG: hypothetical protein RLZZ182_154 [Pseudomonadota bacterium]
MSDNKVKVIVQAAQTLLQGGKYFGEGSTVELDAEDATEKERQGVVKRAVFIGTDPADLAAAVQHSVADASVITADQVAAGLTQAIGALQLANDLDAALPQTSGASDAAANSTDASAADAAAEGNSQADQGNQPGTTAGETPASDAQVSAPAAKKASRVKAGA